MASGVKSAAAMVIVDEDLSKSAGLRENASWEKRLSQARIQRKKALELRNLTRSDHKGANSNAVSPAILPDNSHVAAALGAPPSLQDVLETRNLNERMELAQLRHSQLHNNRPQSETAQGFEYSHNSTAVFKKVVLDGVSVGNTTKHNSPTAPATVASVSEMLPLSLPASARVDQLRYRPRKWALVVLFFAAVAIGAIGSVVI